MTTDRLPMDPSVPRGDVATQPRILIVEDETELAALLEHNLRRNGMTPITAHDGLTACRLVGSEAPEVILLDILLPDLDGWEICRMVRAHPQPAIARTPIIMMTALGRTADRLRGIELDADAYFPKPYSLREIMLKTAHLVGRHRAWLELESELGRLRQQTCRELAEQRERGV